MQKNQRSTRITIPGVDYTPALLSKGTNDDWRIVFYALNPQTNKLDRIRKRVKPMANQKARNAYANKIIAEINKLLQEGWNPYVVQENVNAFNNFIECMDTFLNRSIKMVKDGYFRPDTLRAYTSYVNNIKRYMQLKSLNDMYVISFTKRFVNNFLDWIYNEQRNSPTTHNNYLQFLKTLGSYLLDREFIAANPCDGITKFKEFEKKRTLIPEDVRIRIYEYLQGKNPNYLTLCLMTFYCLVRRTEITKMKVGNIDFNKGAIFIGQDISKSRKNDWITIPSDFHQRLLDHTMSASADMYLFSSDFTPGYTQMKPKRISDEWALVRKRLDIEKSYQFYSLKDTGITELLENGTPSLSVKNQARHSDITMTEKYVQKRSTTDDFIQRNKLKFK